MTQTANSKRLTDLNDALLIKFKSREALQVQLAATTDPVLIDSLQEKILTLRNEIVEKVIADVPDLLDTLAFKWNNAFSFDEAKSYILENLLEAVSRYKSTKKPFCRFTSFFWMYNKNILRNRLKTLNAAKRNQKKTYSLDALCSSRSDEESPRYDVFSYEEDLYGNFLNKAVLKALYEKATPKQKRVFKRLYFGYSQSDIARALGVTGTNVNTVIRNLRKNLEKML